MNSLGSLVKEYKQVKTKKTERGELLNYFTEKVNKTSTKKFKIGFIAYKLTGIKTKDLYYIKSVCDEWENDGKPWGALFFKLLKS